MPSPFARAAAFAAVLVLAVALAGCSDDPTSGKAAPSTTARPAATSTTAAPTSDDDPATATTARGVTPVAGDCIEPVTPTTSGGPQLPALVPCTDPHGGEIVSVSTLDDGPDAAYPAIDGFTDSATAALTACQGDGTSPSTFDEFAGDNRIESPGSKDDKAGAHEAWIVSSLEAVLFVPGPAAWSHGARWAACSAVLRNSSGDLARYDGSARGLRSPGKLTDPLAWCRTDEDQSGNFAVVACDQPHSLEQVASFRVAAEGDAYPGNDEIDGVAGRLCPGLASTATAKRSDSAAEADFGLSWTFPREEDWAQGDRTGRCYMRSLNAPSTGSFAAGTATA
jgi:hypothetical protein